MRMLLPQSPGRRYQAGMGFTLVEMMVTCGIAMLALAVAAQMSMFTARSFVAMGNYADLDRASQNALDRMSREIREAKVLGYYTTHQLIFTNMNDPNSSFGYRYYPDQQRLVRLTWLRDAYGITQTSSNSLLSGCDFFSFRIWLRNPTNGFWFPYSAAGQATAAKLVDVSWRCKRRVLTQYNTESVQTAKIVLRN